MTIGKREEKKSRKVYCQFGVFVLVMRGPREHWKEGRLNNGKINGFGVEKRRHRRRSA